MASDERLVSSEFKHWGFGQSALEVVASTLRHDLASCGRDGEGGQCGDEHFYPHAEAALRGLALAVQVPKILELEEYERKIVDGDVSREDHRRRLEKGVNKLSMLSQGYGPVAGVFINQAEAKCLGAKLFIRDRK
jgi:hypothetical protein